MSSISTSKTNPVDSSLMQRMKPISFIGFRVLKGHGVKESDILPLSLIRIEYLPTHLNYLIINIPCSL